jgi:uncharacterized small protein (DUF1192 family)
VPNDFAGHATLWGAITGAVVAVGGWISTTRKNRTDAVTVFSEAAVRLVLEREKSERDIREEFEEHKIESAKRQAVLEHKIALLVEEVEKCKAERQQIIDLARAAGVPLNDAFVQAGED